MMRMVTAQLRNSVNDVYCSVSYDDILKATIDIWTGPFETKENMISGLNCVLDNIKTFGSEKWLADLSRMTGEFGSMHDYIPDNIIPRAMQMGLKYEALVLPYDIFSMLSVQTTLEKIEGFEISIFDNFDEAARWLNAKST